MSTIKNCVKIDTILKKKMRPIRYHVSEFFSWLTLSRFLWGIYWLLMVLLCVVGFALWICGVHGYSIPELLTAGGGAVFVCSGGRIGGKVKPLQSTRQAIKFQYGFLPANGSGLNLFGRWYIVNYVPNTKYIELIEPER